MTYDEIVKRLAPCGLDCGRCAGYAGGEIRALAQRMKDLLGNYGRVAKLQLDALPAFEHYPEFEEILGFFAAASCGSCRSEELRCPIDCKAGTCHKEKGVDFCFQCPEYPCGDPMNIPPLIDRWKIRNDRMKAIGVAEFYDEQKGQPRYP